MKESSIQQRVRDAIEVMASFIDKDELDLYLSEELECLVESRVETVCKLYRNEAVLLVELVAEAKSDNFKLNELLKPIRDSPRYRAFKQSIEDLLLTILFAGENGIKNLNIKMEYSEPELARLERLDSQIFESLRNHRDG